ATKAVRDSPALDSQMSVLRKLTTRGPLPPATIAAELHLARPTVSNLLKSMIAEGLVERRPSPEDGRSALISPTEHGRAVLETFRHDRTEVIRVAMEQLSPAERASLTAALPALRELFLTFEAMARA